MSRTCRCEAAALKPAREQVGALFHSLRVPCAGMRDE